MHNKDERLLEYIENRLEYPTINDLFPLNKKINVNKIRKSIKNLKKKDKENVIWAKYDVILTHYLKKIAINERGIINILVLIELIFTA